MNLLSLTGVDAVDVFSLDKMLLSDQAPAHPSLDLIKEYLNTSHHVLALIVYFDDKSSFKTLYRYHRLSNNNWRYFKLNCCIFNEKYKQQKKAHKIVIKSFAQGRNIKVFDFIRFLNNYMAAYQLSKGQNKVENFGDLNRAFITKEDLANDLTDVNFLIEKADELASYYGFNSAEEFFYDKLIDEQNCVELVINDES